MAIDFMIVFFLMSFVLFLGLFAKLTPKNGKSNKGERKHADRQHFFTYPMASSYAKQRF